MRYINLRFTLLCLLTVTVLFTSLDVHHLTSDMLQTG